MRCRSSVPQKTLLIRSRSNCEGPRCCRRGKFNGHCYQHATDHDRIVERILEIPPRPPYD